MKQVLFIGMSPNQGGIETFMINIFLKLENHGFHFTFINTSKRPLAYQNTILNNGGSIKRVFIGNSILGHLIRYYKAYSFFNKHHNFDIIHLNAVTINTIFWIRAAEKFNINRLIIQSHNDGIIYNSFIKRFFANIVARINDKYLNRHNNIVELAVSKNSGKWMFRNNRFKIIKNGVNVNKYKFSLNNRSYIKNKLNLSNKNKIVMTVARLEPQKNYYKIIRIFYLVHKLLPQAVLVIAGDGSEKRNLIKLAKNIDIYNYIFFLGSINNVAQVLSIADVILMPSKYEGFPFSLLECQSVGVPAIVSKGIIPSTANITGQIRYLSLNDSNMKWARLCVYELNNTQNIKDKINMNNIIRNSDYNDKNMENRIKKIYLN